MRAFQVVCVAVAAATSSYGQFYGSTYGNTYGLGANTYGGQYSSGYNYAPSYGGSYSSGYNYAPASYGASYSTGYTPSYGVASYGASYAAPAYAVGASYHAAAPLAQVATIAHAPAAAIKSHEIHTGSGRQAIRIEDFQAGDQVIRVHEGQQAAPQIAQVQVPGEQHHIRVVNHQSGPAQVERVVHRQQTQVVDVQKPGRPGARIVQVVKGESPAPSIEFVNAGGQHHHVYHANEGTGYSGAVSGASYAPAASYGASYGSSYGTGYGYGSTYASPISYGASYGSADSYLSAPSTSIGGVHYGSTGFGNTGFENTYGSTAVIAKA